MLLVPKSKCEIFWKLITFTNEEQSTAVRRPAIKFTQLKLIFLSFLCASWFILLFSFIHLINVTAISFSSLVGQQVTILFFSLSIHCSLESAISFFSVFTGRRSVIISIGRWFSFSISPARNWKTSCHLQQFLMFSETNFLKTLSFMFFTMCVAAKNSCIVRWMKQNCSSSSNAIFLGSGKRWKRALSSIPRTLFPSRISFPSLIPSNATLPRSSFTSEGKSSDRIFLRARFLSRNSFVCLK